MSFLSPASLIRSAKAAHPAFKYAIVVAGLAAIVSVVLHFGASPATLVFGSIIIVALMTLFLVFAQATSISKTTMALPALVLIWSFMIITIFTVILLFISTFFDFPLPLKTAIMRNTPAPSESLIEKEIPLYRQSNHSMTSSSQSALPTLLGVDVTLIYSKLDSKRMEDIRKILKEAGAIIHPEPWLAEQMPIIPIIKYGNDRKREAEAIHELLGPAMGELDLEILDQVGKSDIELYLGQRTPR
jgi:hypothetical protein